MVMSNFVPRVEKQVIWGYTEEQIKERWKVWQDWDLLYRMFGSSNDSYTAKSNIPKPNITGKALEKLLDNIN